MASNGQERVTVQTQRRGLVVGMPFKKPPAGDRNARAGWTVPLRPLPRWLGGAGGLQGPCPAPGTHSSHGQPMSSEQARDPAQDRSRILERMELGQKSSLDGWDGQMKFFFSVAQCLMDDARCETHCNYSAGQQGFISGDQYSQRPSRPQAARPTAHAGSGTDPQPETPCASPQTPTLGCHSGRSRVDPQQSGTMHRACKNLLTVVEMFLARVGVRARAYRCMKKGNIKIAALFNNLHPFSSQHFTAPLWGLHPSPGAGNGRLLAPPVGKAPCNSRTGSSRAASAAWEVSKEPAPKCSYFLFPSVVLVPSSPQSLIEGCTDGVLMLN
ncbi:uncharacterized protein LJ206_019887 isoform 1-T1 [Theristicus caerulescens]